MEQLITLHLRSTSDCILPKSFTPPRSVRRLQIWRVPSPIQPDLFCANRPENSSTNTERLLDKPVIPAKHPRRVSSLRKIYQSQTPLALYTRKDWKLAVEDVKLLYFKRQYKLCAERCISILENHRGHIHYCHSLFFSFYAATCLELQALPLQAESSARLPLLMHAKAYYEIAASYISSAETTCSSPSQPSLSEESHNRSLSSSSSTSSISNSSSDSLALQCSPLSSPASSVCDFDSLEKDIQKMPSKKRSLKLQSATLQPKKKVSFQLEPILIGNGGTSVTSNTSEERIFPLVPPGSKFMQKTKSILPYGFPQGPPPTIPLPTPPPKNGKGRSFPLCPPTTQLPKPVQSEIVDRQATITPLPRPVQSEVMDRQAIIHYQSQLLSFKPHVSHHLSKLLKMIHDTTTASSKAILRSTNYEDSTVESPIVGWSELQSLSVSPEFPNFSRKRECAGSNASCLQYTHSGDMNLHDGEIFSVCGDESMDGSERRKIHMSLKDKRRRIEEGEKRMWMRERFDGSRYERLCERALMELQH